MTVYLNQRESQRDPIVGKILYSRDPDGICYDARLKNCTRKGMAFVADYPYLRKTHLFLHSKNKNDTSVQKAEVAWSKPVFSEDINHPARYAVGVKFL